MRLSWSRFAVSIPIARMMRMTRLFEAGLIERALELRDHQRPEAPPPRGCGSSLYFYVFGRFISCGLNHARGGILAHRRFW